MRPNRKVPESAPFWFQSISVCCWLVARMAASYESPLVKRTICLLWRLSGRRWRSALAW